MTPDLASRRKGKRIEIRPRPHPGSDSPGCAPLLDAVQAPEERVRRARRNMRRHLALDGLRISTLVVADALSLYLLRAVAELVLASSHPVAVLPAVQAGARLVATGSGLQYLLALIASLALVRCYRAGETWWHAAGVARGVGIATGVHLWSTAWPPTVMNVIGAAGVVLPLAATLVIARQLLHLVVDAGAAPLHRRTARAVLVGPLSACARALTGRTLADPRSFSVVGIVTTDFDGAGQTLGTVEELHRIVHQSDVDTVILCGDAVEESIYTRVAQSVLPAECRVLALPAVLEADGLAPRLVSTRRRHFIELRGPAGRWQQFVLKRSFDIVASVVLILLLSPVLLAIALLVRLDSPGPVLFGHIRYGRAGQRFRMLKFRSMRPDAERMLMDHPELYERFLANDCKLPEHEDPRLTSIGRWLRKTSLDELPQLFNVLKGEMSLVGPRPVVEAELTHYDNWLLTVQAMRPGMTGWWQVNGRSSIPWPQRAEFDVHYAVHWSFGLDLRILVLTAPAVLSQRGAY